MINEEHSESLLRDYLLNHPPLPFESLVGVGMDPTRTGCHIFREPGTLNDLVISTKFISESHPNRRTENAALGTVWEHALYSGMAWRQEMRQKQNNRHWDSSTRLSSPFNYNRANVERKDCDFLPSLIIAATFTNRFGLELVCHVEELPMKDVQYRFMMESTTTSVAAMMLHTMIWGEVPIYRCHTHDLHSPWNLIGFAGTGNQKETDCSAKASRKLSIESHSRIMERNNSASSSNRRLPTDLKELVFPLSTEILCFLRTALPVPSFRSAERKFLINNMYFHRQTAVVLDDTASPNYKKRVVLSDTRENRPPHHTLPFVPSNTTPPSPLGPFAPRFEEKSCPDRYTYPSGVNYLVPAKGNIPNTAFPIQESRDHNFLQERSHSISPISRDTIPTESHVENDFSTVRIGTDENHIFDKYNILGFLFDENKDDIRDRSSSQRDPVPKQRTRLLKPKAVRKLKTASSYYSDEEREPPKTARSSDGHSSKRSKKKRIPRDRRSIGKASVLENRSVTRSHISKVLSKDGDHNEQLRSPSKDDIAINLLCPYQHPPNRSFVISHETPIQQAFRNKIEGSPSCLHLMGKFAMEFFPNQTLGAGVIGGRWTIRRV